MFDYRRYSIDAEHTERCFCQIFLPKGCHWYWRYNQRIARFLREKQENSPLPSKTREISIWSCRLNGLMVYFQHMETILSLFRTLCSSHYVCLTRKKKKGKINVCVCPPSLSLLNVCKFEKELENHSIIVIWSMCLFSFWLLHDEAFYIWHPQKIANTQDDDNGYNNLVYLIE